MLKALVYVQINTLISTMILNQCTPTGEGVTLFEGLANIKNQNMVELQFLL